MTHGLAQRLPFFRGYCATEWQGGRNHGRRLGPIPLPNGPNAAAT
jgi:hypothetical protein